MLSGWGGGGGSGKRKEDVTEWRGARARNASWGLLGKSKSRSVTSKEKRGYKRCAVGEFRIGQGSEKKKDGRRSEFPVRHRGKERFGNQTNQNTERAAEAKGEKT